MTARQQPPPQTQQSHRLWTASVILFFLFFQLMFPYLQTWTQCRLLEQAAQANATGGRFVERVHRSWRRVMVQKNNLSWHKCGDWPSVLFAFEIISTATNFLHLRYISKPHLFLINKINWLSNVIIPHNGCVHILTSTHTHAHTRTHRHTRTCTRTHTHRFYKSMISTLWQIQVISVSNH